VVDPCEEITDPPRAPIECVECGEPCDTSPCEDCIARYKQIMDDEAICDDELVCSGCNGSGEGMHEFTKCRTCKGSGVEPTGVPNDA